MFSLYNTSLLRITAFTKIRYILVMAIGRALLSECLIKVSDEISSFLVRTVLIRAPLA